MYCKTCGAEISDDAKFCASCGTQIHNEDVKETKKLNYDSEKALFKAHLINIIAGVLTLLGVFLVEGARRG